MNKTIISVALLALLVCLSTSTWADPQQTKETRMKILDADGAVAALQSGVTALDVRSRDEWEDGHLRGATHVPVEAVADTVAEYLADKSAPVLIYCRSGGRATHAAEVMLSQGYTDVRVLRPGGFEDLQAAQLPVE